MQIKTTGIVLNATKYSDTAIIVAVYTQQFGRSSYMVYGINKKKSAFRPAFLQPLTLVEMDVYHTPGKEIHRIKDIRITSPFKGIPFHPVRNSLALFITEVLSRALQQSEPDEQLFDFLENAIQTLDTCERGLANFHLVFMLKLAHYMGFEPNHEGNDEKYFDLMNGIFATIKPVHPHFLSAELTALFIQLSSVDFSDMDNVVLSRDLRYKMLESLVEYYKLHLPDFRAVNSLSVLHDLFE